MPSQTWSIRAYGPLCHYQHLLSYCFDTNARIEISVCTHSIRRQALQSPMQVALAQSNVPGILSPGPRQTDCTKHRLTVRHQPALHAFGSHHHQCILQEAE